MKFGEKLNPLIGNTRTYSKMKYEVRKQKHLDANVIQSILKLKYSSESNMKNIIKDINSDPLIVSYWLPEQTKIAKLWAEQFELILIFDATGNCGRPVEIETKCERQFNKTGVSTLIYCY